MRFLDPRIELAVDVCVRHCSVDPNPWGQFTYFFKRLASDRSWEMAEVSTAKAQARAVLMRIPSIRDAASATAPTSTHHPTPWGR
jgi:hypothetical protein